MWTRRPSLSRSDSSLTSMFLCPVSVCPRSAAADSSPLMWKSNAQYLDSRWSHMSSQACYGWIKAHCCRAEAGTVEGGLAFIKASHCGCTSPEGPSACPGGWSWHSYPLSRGSAGACSCLCPGPWRSSGCHCPDKIHQNPTHQHVCKTWQHSTRVTRKLSSLFSSLWSQTRGFGAAQGSLTHLCRLPVTLEN